MQKIKYPVGSTFLGKNGYSESSIKEAKLVDKSKEEYAGLLQFGRHDFNWVTQEILDDYYKLVSSPQWIPKRGEEYYTWDDEKVIIGSIWCNDDIDLFRLKQGKVSKSRNECQKKIDEINSRDI